MGNSISAAKATGEIWKALGAADLADVKNVFTRKRPARGGYSTTIQLQSWHTDAGRSQRAGVVEKIKGVAYVYDEPGKITVVWDI